MKGSIIPQLIINQPSFINYIDLHFHMFNCKSWQTSRLNSNQLISTNYDHQQSPANHHLSVIANDMSRFSCLKSHSYHSFKLLQPMAISQPHCPDPQSHQIKAQRHHTLRWNLKSAGCSHPGRVSWDPTVRPNIWNPYDFVVVFHGDLRQFSDFHGFYGR